MKQNRQLFFYTLVIPMLIMLYGIALQPGYSENEQPGGVALKPIVNNPQTVLPAAVTQPPAVPVSPPVSASKPTGFAADLTDYSTPISISKEEMIARLLSVKDRMFFIDNKIYLGNTSIETDNFLLPNADYATMTFTWTKLINTDGINIIRPGTAEEIKEENTYHRYCIYCVHD